MIKRVKRFDEQSFDDLVDYTYTATHSYNNKASLLSGRETMTNQMANH